ncbi:conserved hypothetical protein [Talaromyces stipitatus ATCC 10500]|uniref:Luciferase domain-containing protein n=1 Tax=Talaromyces stipitatus (strain ATCC 10500 / CBS 375.48 / QM 6759 / NRRL 1006) TaxID=441959 RepID=B8MPJ2_TALSN|nr:uncharacterized protein TSTA_106400 [Talaromyces stipitatus ATCC 10500]EED14431.1 conserved hypothetical protein [Talaromyces stipitatus ATCC 10500]
MSSLFSVLRRHPILTTATAVVIAAMSTSAYRDYGVFISYGPGGPPHNALGWFMSRFLATPFGQEMFNTGMYTRRMQNGENASYIILTDGGQLPRRHGERPVIGPHVVPQRQLSQMPSANIQKDFVADFYALAGKNSHIIKVARSKAERQSDAMSLVDSVPRTQEASQTGGEIAHIHETGDHSLHVILSPADAKQVIDAGWGQRHAFSGWRPWGGIFEKIVDIPATYLLIYAPRTSDETQIILEIVKASMRYMSLGAEIIS